MAAKMMKYKRIISFFISFLVLTGTNGQGQNRQSINSIKQGIKQVFPNNPIASATLNLLLNTVNIDDITARAGALLTSGVDNVFNDMKDNVTEKCLNDTRLMLESIAGTKPWALKMIDAFGKPGSDILDGRFTWLGSYDECRAVQADLYTGPENETSPTHPFMGQYCTSTFYLDPKMIGGSVQSPYPLPAIPLAIGVCFPDSCSNQDITMLAATLIGIVPGINTTTFAPPVVECNTDIGELDTKAIAAICVCGVIALLMLIGTSYDLVYLYCKQAHNKNKQIEPINSKYIPEDEKANGSPPPYTIEMKTNGTEHTTDNGTAPPVGDGLTFGLSEDSCMEPGLCGRLLLAFSVYTNASKLLSTSKSSGTLTAVNGIRFFSMSWVVLGHTYVFGQSTAGNMFSLYPTLFKRWSMQPILNGTFSVDTFFVLSGLLVGYLTLKELKKCGGVKNFSWGMFYFHRFWRLTPPMMLWIMVEAATSAYWTNGPLWPKQGLEIDECEGTWWYNILYINNLVDNLGKTCLGWSWYLANDMQFFIISPLMVIPLYYSKIAGTLSCLVFVLISFISRGIMSSEHGYVPNIMQQTEDQSDMYVKPWSRVGPYAVGIFVGYVLYITKCKVKIPKALNVFGWLLATAGGWAIIYGLYDSQGMAVTRPEAMSETASYVYIATSRTVWGVCVAWVVFACATGYGGPVNILLSWSALVPLSRLTYCTYLVHETIMEVYYSTRHKLIELDDLEVIYLFLGHLCLAFMVAFVVSLSFESPMMGLEKVLFAKKKNK